MISKAAFSCSVIVLGFLLPCTAVGEAIDARSDLFSLGSVLYELCTGRPSAQRTLWPSCGEFATTRPGPSAKSTWASQKPCAR
jgi:serine/threonine protein kinase